MTATTELRTVGILNSTEDVIALLVGVLEDEGYATRAAYIPDFKRGRGDLATWLGDLDPTAILYDIPPPYDKNWAFYRQTLALPQARPHRFIITTTNKRILERLAGSTDAIELIGRPFDLAEIVYRVGRALAAIDAGP
jgi:CheY-like chemotaxis protein